MSTDVSAIPWTGWIMHSLSAAVFLLVAVLHHRTLHRTTENYW